MYRFKSVCLKALVYVKYFQACLMNMRSKRDLKQACVQS